MRPDALPVIAIFGPTASGKTAVARALAALIPGEIVSADALQVYRGLPILTNQSAEPERLVAIWPLSHAASVGEYAGLAHAAIDEIIAAGRTAIVMGGTGLYLRAAVAELDVPPAPPPGARERAESTYDRLGALEAHGLLERRDPAAAATVHPNDRRRVVRALELAEAGASLRPAQDRLWAATTRHPTVLVGLDVPPSLLASRIEARARAMFDRGVEAEVAAALELPLSHTARQVIGLREIAELPREDAIPAIIRRTTRYAGYQRKWLRRLPDAVSVRADRPPEDVAAEVLEVARARQRVSAGRAG